MSLMAAHAAPVKTQLGLDELRGRARTLGQRHRTVLLLVDGRRPLSEVLGLALQAGAQTSHFEDLVRMGMVELPSAGAASETHDSPPSAFDALRVTSVELEVPGGPAAPSAVSDSPLPDELDVEPARSAAAATSAPVPGRAAADDHLVPQAPARGADDPPSRVGAPGPSVGPDPGVHPAHDVAPSLQQRQLPLAALVKPEAAPQRVVPPPPRRATTPPAPVESVPSRRAPLESIPAVPSRRMPLEQTPVAASRRMPLEPTPVSAPVQPKPMGAPALRGAAVPALPARGKAAAFDDQAVRGTREAANPPRSVPGTLPAQGRSNRSTQSAQAAMGIPTLPVASGSPAARVPGRRTVLSRLASPRAGSLREPDEPDATRLERVRELLVETLRIDAPLFGMRMLVRLRAATRTDDLIELVWDIERHLISARHSREEMLNLQRARELLGLGNTVVADDD
jgi:hypothetical protein